MSEPTDPQRRRLIATAVALATVGGAGNSFLHAAEPARTFRFGMNVSRGAYWNTTQNFRNLLLDSDDGWRDAATGKPWAPHEWGWPEQVPAGAAVVRVIRYNDRVHPRGLPSAVFLKSGRYVARTKGGWNVQLVNVIGVSQMKPGRDVCTFTVAEGEKPFRIELHLTNANAKPQTLRPGDLVICEVDDEAALRADPYAFRAEVLENYRGFTMLRNGDVSGQNGSYPYTDASSVCPVSHFNGGEWPPEIFAKLCREVGAGMWINLPTFIDHAEADCAKATSRFRLIKNGAPLPPPPNGAKMMYTRSGDSTRPAGFDLGPYAVCNRDEKTGSFQLADLETPTVPKTVNVDIGPSYQTNMTRLYDYEALWRSYVQRHHDVYPMCPVVRTEPFLENWNFGYIGGQLCDTLGNYYRSGSRKGGNRLEGQGFFIFKAWKVVEERFGRERHVRTAATFISAWVGSGLMDVADVTGEIQRGAQLGQLVRTVAPATYYSAYEPAVPALGTVDWNDPRLNVIGRMQNKTFLENGELTRDKILAEWRAKGPFSNARWVEVLSQSFHFMQLNLRLWRDKMASFGRKLGQDYDFAAYECGNHQRRDRPADYKAPDLDLEVQDSFIAFNFGPSPEARAFRESYRKLHVDNGFALAMYFHMAGDWFRASGQLNQWGSLPWYGAEKTHPELRGWYDFLKANA